MIIDSCVVLESMWPILKCFKYTDIKVTVEIFIDRYVKNYRVRPKLQENHRTFDIGVFQTAQTRFQIYEWRVSSTRLIFACMLNSRIYDFSWEQISPKRLWARREVREERTRTFVSTIHSRLAFLLTERVHPAFYLSTIKRGERHYFILPFIFVINSVTSRREVQRDSLMMLLENNFYFPLRHARSFRGNSYLYIE